jgi:hypothetical protein
MKSDFIPHPSSFILWSGAEGEIRTLETNLEDSHVSSYITSAIAFPIANCRLVRKEQSAKAKRNYSLPLALRSEIGNRQSKMSFGAPSRT